MKYEDEVRYSVDVLGTKYTIVETDNSEKLKQRNADGVIDYTIQEITLEKTFSGETKDGEWYQKLVKRHELIHAFLFESGATKYSEDEDLIEILSIQFPKMLKAFEEVDAL